MKFYTLLFLTILVSHASHAADVDEKTIQSRTAVALFTKVCFSNYGQHEKRIAFLNSSLPKHEGEKKEVFLKLFKAQHGEVWAAELKQGSFAIVVEENQNCHLVAHKADEAAIHQEIKKISETAQKNLPKMQIKYHDVSGSAPKSSGFSVIGPSGTSLIVVVTNTLDNAPDNKPAALLTMVVN